MALLPFPFFFLSFFSFFFLSFVRSVTRPSRRFSSVECSPRLDSFFSALSKRNFATKIRDESRISFLVFNGPMENRFGSDAIAANLFRAAFTIARVSHSWQNGDGKRYLGTWIERAFCHAFSSADIRFDCIRATFMRGRNGALYRFNCTLFSRNRKKLSRMVYAWYLDRDTEITRHRFAV